MAVDTEDPIRLMQQGLKAQGYMTNNEELLLRLSLALKTAGQDKGLYALVMDGPPGTGKTYAAECFLKLLGDEARMYRLQFTQGVGREHLMDDLHLANIITAQSTRQVLNTDDVWLDGVMMQAIKSSHLRPTVLLLDELDKAKPTVDAFLLEFLQMGGLSLPQRSEEPFMARADQLFVFITKNDERMLSGPLMRRARVIHLTWPDPEMEWRMLRVLTRKFAEAHPDTLPAEYHRGAPEGMCKAIATYAQRIRRFERQLSRVPSTPELYTCLLEMLLTQPKGRRGMVAFSVFFKNPDDMMLLRSAKNEKNSLAWPELQEVKADNVVTKSSRVRAIEAFAGTFASF